MHSCAAIILKSSFVVLLTVTFISCGAAHRDAESNSSHPSDAFSIEDSGKRLSGDWEVKSVDDEYAKKSAQGAARTTFRFREDGGFAIERESRAVEEGAYIIGKQNELVLYIEKAGGEFRGEARIMRYLMTDQTDDSMNLRSSPTAVMVLKKR